MLDDATHTNGHAAETVSSMSSGEDAMARVLAAAKRAPLVPMTDHERNALAEVDEDDKGTPAEVFLEWLGAQSPSA